MAWSLVTSTPATNQTTATPDVITLGAAVLVNDRVIVGIGVTRGSSTAPTLDSISDQLGNTYNQDALTPVLSDGTLRVRAWLYSALVTVAGTPVITVAYTGTGSAAAAAGYRGLSTVAGAAAAVDVSVLTGTGTSTTPSSGATAATRFPNELVIGLETDDGNATFAAAGSSTLRGSVHNAQNGIGFEEQDSGAIGSTITSSGTIAPSSTWGMMAVVYHLRSAVPDYPGLRDASFPIRRVFVVTGLPTDGSPERRMMLVTPGPTDNVDRASIQRVTTVTATAGMDLAPAFRAWSVTPSSTDPVDQAPPLKVVSV